MTGPYGALTDAELTRAELRAWREAARCWAELRAYREFGPGTRELRALLLRGAQSAENYWHGVHRASVARGAPTGRQATPEGRLLPLAESGRRADR